jgi:hypothetical protein
MLGFTPTLGQSRVATTAASEISSSEEEDVAGDENEDVFSVARPREVVPTTVDLISSRQRERERESLVSLFV